MPHRETDSCGNYATVYYESELSQKQKAELYTKETVSFSKVDFRIRNSLDKLTLKQRDIINLYFFKYSKPNQKKLAKLLGISERAVRYRLHNAIGRLKKELKR